MSAGLADGHRLTVEEYLHWAETQPDGRYELVDGVPLKLSPERNRHLLVKGAVYRTFLDAVRSAALDCVVLPDGATIVIGRHQSREPDLSIVCGSTLDLDSRTVESAVVLLEVTSPSTLRTDTSDKLIDYFSLPSVRHYVLVHPTQRSTVHHHRDEAGAIHTSIVSEGLLRFDPPGFEVDVERFFDDLPTGDQH